MKKNMFVLVSLIVMASILLSACAVKYEGVPSCKIGTGDSAVYVADGDPHPTKPGWVCKAVDRQFVKADSSVTVPSSSDPTVTEPTVTEPTAAPVAAPVVNLDSPTVNNPSVWNEPQSQGNMNVDSKIVYTQSGKKGEQIITGTVAEGDNFVVTAYRLTQAGKVYDNGVVLVIEGPFDLTANPIDIVDGAGTVVTKESTQTKLDSMWIDFCRGDKTLDEKSWSYKPWALANITVGEFSFPKLSECFNASNDTFPNNPPPAN